MHVVCENVYKVSRTFRLSGAEGKCQKKRHELVGRGVGGICSEGYGKENVQVCGPHLIAINRKYRVGLLRTSTFMQGFRNSL